MLRRTLIAFLVTGLIAGWAGSAAAQSVAGLQTVISDGPSAVSVTVYRNPQRSSGTVMNLQYLGGYALVTEQRTVNLPAGEVELRFEGVAGGIIPQSAIVTGLADGVIEKNRNAALLSPSALLNGHLGRGVTIRRTNVASGKTEEFDAMIRTDASAGVVIQTADGFEALRCSGLNDAIIYPAIPEGLSAKPTLSVKSRITEATRATVTLSYLATGFDWEASYVADIADDGQTLNLFSWVTLANSDETSFLNAQAQTVAGQPNKERDDIAPISGGSISLRCWPQATTSDIALRNRAALGRLNSWRTDEQDVITVTASKRSGALMEMAAPLAITAQQEELGDLKLYRIPVPVTIASQSQKQVAMFEKEQVQFVQIYKAELRASASYDSPVGLSTVLRMQNRKRDGLGLAMPAGRLVAFREAGGARLMLGEGSVDDKAIGEEVDITINRSPLVRYTLSTVDDVDVESRSYADKQVTITNASPRAAKVEVKIRRYDTERITRASEKLGRKDGSDLWSVTVPANGERTLSFRLNRRR
ncbi:hypothetical protein SAMN02745824_3384 [Parasphingorhabdus marina DSM 22363]|uniref:DUF4139 domain-containing protein n=1 Tax=Parasphingorhabdus marina DSM 22363 TaxID=1123272 RepID=A0A1N6HNK2_9SPHN|nr:hypothetical protein [Parasphingorhabdus marina]SIO21428.1 hypothetical protein SAMN02745824_3384 [Parasphingorhabdus marina DSM 22363]